MDLSPQHIATLRRNAQRCRGRFGVWCVGGPLDGLRVAVRAEPVAGNIHAWCVPTREGPAQVFYRCDGERLVYDVVVVQDGGRRHVC